MGSVSMLVEVNPLPGAKIKSTTMDGYADIRQRQRAANVGRHIVWPFGGVAEAGITIWHQVCQKTFKIYQHLRIGVFHNHHRGAGMVNEAVTQSINDPTLPDQLMQLRSNFKNAASVARKLKICIGFSRLYRAHRTLYANLSLKNFPELKNDTLLRALLRQPTDYTPVWVMRQAGRYLPEYRKIRAQAGDFMSLCRNAELACEVTMQPLRRFDLDAAILFSDILTIPDAMGLGLHFETGEGPRFERPLRDARAIAALGIPDVEDDLGYVMNAVRTIRAELGGSVPLIGFAGSPWTLATYMIEGGASRDFRRAKQLLLDQPDAAHQLLGKLADTTVNYLNAQSAAGAQALMIFDTWGGALNPVLYQQFSLHYMNRILAGLVRERDGRIVPTILFTKGAGPRLREMAQSGCDALGVDWTVDLNDARRWVDDKVALQGNLDPSTLYASPATIRAQVKATLASYADGPGHVFNLGHGITPQVPSEHLGVLVDAVHQLSYRGTDSPN
nr:uroporphyrinogen decarboxylase-like [Nerophis lumbriciformis]